MHGPCAGHDAQGVHEALQLLAADLSELGVVDLVEHHVPRRRHDAVLAELLALVLARTWRGEARARRCA